MNINATLFGQMITFALFVWVTMRFVWPPLEKALQEREDTIASGLKAAEKGQQTLEQAAIEAEEALKEARSQAHVMLQEARRQADDLVKEAREHGEAEKAKIIASAQGQMDANIRQAREALLDEVVTLAVSGAERILVKHFDGQATFDEKTLKQLAHELGESRA